MRDGNEEAEVSPSIDSTLIGLVSLQRAASASKLDTLMLSLPTFKCDQSCLIEATANWNLGSIANTV